MGSVGPGVVINNRYALERQIGIGGMATVWLADDRLLGRKVAVKILSDRYAADPGFVERFRREASAAASLSHQNIVAVYDRGETDGSYYIVMEYLPGPDLKAIIREHGRLEPRHAVDAALQILAALTAAHKRDLIHRDIKPQNVLVSADGHLKVTDFGIARAGDESDMTDAGSVIGTAQYLSPEQARGADVTTASDCYAVGIVLYEMLTGRVPFDGGKPVAIAMRQVNEPPIAPSLLVPSIPDALNAVVMRALEKRPGSRYRTAEEFTQALMAVRPLLPSPTQTTQMMSPVDQATQMLPPARTPAPAPEPRATRTVLQPSRPTPPPPEPKRRRGITIAAIILAMVIATGLGIALFTSIGRGGVAVPTLSGLTKEAAVRALANAELKVSPDDEVRPSATVAAGFVIDSDPTEGTKVDAGTVVRLIVSSGPELATVPDVSGKTKAVATEQLRKAGFRPKFTEDFSSDVDKGLVMDQTPPAGTQRAVGEVVNVVISKGPDLVLVPDIVGLTAAKADAALRKAGLTPGDVTERVSSSVAAGTVLEQTPGKGKRVARDSAVKYVVAIKPTTVPMPDLVGMSAELARQKLIDSGLNDPTSANQTSDEPEGTVVGQDPPKGTLIDPVSQAITIFVSTGPTSTGAGP